MSHARAVFRFTALIAPLGAMALMLAPTAGAARILSGERGPAKVGTLDTTTPIQHVVMILKENRSFDEYFGRFPGANGTTAGRMSDGTIVPLTQTPDPMPHDMGHSYKDFGLAFDGGANDAFDLEKGAYGPNGQLIAYTQMNEASIPNYWQYARTYGLGDNMYSDYRGSSFGNNLFMVAAQSGREEPSMHFRAVNGLPRPPRGQSLNQWWGCDDPSGTRVTLLGADNSLGRMFPCFTFSSLPNALDAHGVSWKAYASHSDNSNVHNVLDAVDSVRHDPRLWSNDVELSTFIPDAETGTLPAVSWVYSKETEHPTQMACTGENESVALINAIMSGPDWSSTVIFIVWDDWGGFYDHVPPPQPDNISYGFRVPLLVISPWVKYGGGSNGGSIDSTFFSHSSILKFVEDNWSIPPLTTRDAGANDPVSFLDFDQIPKPPLLLTTRTCPRLTKAQLRSATDAARED